jgi:hypothetical protein
MAKKTKPTSQALVPQERITRLIILLRGQKVMLDMQLAEFYE